MQQQQPQQLALQFQNQIDQNQLQLILQLLDSMKIPDNVKQQQIIQEVEKLKENPLFFCYLAFIFSNPQNYQMDTRLYSIVTLQGQVARNFQKITENDEVFEYVKQQVIFSFNDNSSVISSKIGNIVTAIIQKGGFQQWPEILKFLYNNLLSDNSHTILTTMSCISKIVEDLRLNNENYYQMENNENGKILHQIMPKLLEFCDTKYDSQIRAKSINTLNMCVSIMPEKFEQSLQFYSTLLVQMLYDQNSDIRLRAVQGVNCIMETSYKYLYENNIEDVIKGMSEKLMDEEKEIAKNSCYFWAEYVSEYEEEEELQKKLQILSKYLNILVQGMIKGLRFTEEDQINQDSQQQNYTKTKGDNIGEGETIHGFQAHDDNEGQNDIFDQGETLRRECGVLMQKFSRHYRDDMFLIAKPLISQLFIQQDWQSQEMGILALGSVAEGSLESIYSDLPNLFPVLMDKVEQSNQCTLISTTLWTLTKFTSYIVDVARENEQLVKRYLQLIVKGIQQNDAKVFDSSCNSISVLVDQGSFILEPFLKDILSVFINAMSINSNHSQDMLFDAIQSFVREMSDNLKTQELANMLLGSLVQKLKNYNVDDIQICGIVECLAYVSDVLEDFFMPFCKDSFEKCAQILHNFLFIKDKHSEYNRKEICLRSVDLLQSVVMVTKQDFVQLQQGIDFLNYLKMSLECDHIEIKQFIVSLIAEISKHCPALIQDSLEQLIPLIAGYVEFYPKDLDPEDLSAALCNNAVWCLVEIFNSFFNTNKEVFTPFIVQLAQKLIEFLTSNEKLEMTVQRNFSKALGKLGYLCPQQIAQFLPTFIKQFCLTLRGQTQDQTYAKGNAFQGLFAMIKVNPQGALDNFQYVIDCFVNYKQAKQDLKQEFKQILLDFKGTMDQNTWEQYLSNPQYFQNAFRQKVMDQYGV